MTQATPTDYGIDKIYQSVIDDVINGVKETFLDENIDIDVLHMLKKEWEAKLAASGALDFDSGTRNIPPPAIRQPVVKQQPTQPSQSMPGPSNFHAQQQRPQQAIDSSEQLATAPGDQRSVSTTQTKPHVAVKQLDGGGDDLTGAQALDFEDALKQLGDDLNEEPVTEAVKPVPATIQVKQLDGGGHGASMSDTSSEEEFEEEDESITRFMGLQEERVDESAEGDEEDPLNSNDDQSDDEDLDTLFHADNVIVCQFEKVNRARTKWKFNLKDGIMHLNGKDYCFQKCTGEAEW